MKVILLILSLIGVSVFDVAFAVVVLHYAMQCQLMEYWFKRIWAGTQTKEVKWIIEVYISMIMLFLMIDN